MSKRTRLAVIATLCCLGYLAGCARWSTVPQDSQPINLLPRPKLTPDSVVFEVTFVQVPEDQTDFSDRFWAEVDEAVLSNDLRRQLAANGLRCGLVGRSVPAALQEVLERQKEVEPGGGTKITDPGRQVVARTHRLTSRTGQMGKIIVRSTPLEKMVTLAFDRDGHVSGKTLRKAQCLFSITSFAQGDGDVDIELEPMIEHGEPKSRFRGENGAWMVDNTTRDACIFDEMKLQAKLAPGEALAVTCTDDQCGLGNQFFGTNPQERLPRLLLLIRLQQTQKDDRFLPDQDTLEPPTPVFESPAATFPEPDLRPQ